VAVPPDFAATLDFSSKLSDSVATAKESPSTANAAIKENGDVLAIVNTSKEMQDPKKAEGAIANRYFAFLKTRAPVGRSRHKFPFRVTLLVS
jgi:CRISPR/Cas system-associated endonuclease Cas1